MPPAGFPPDADPNPRLRTAAAGPSEALAVGETGLLALPPAVTAVLTFQPRGRGDGSDPGSRRIAWERWVSRTFAPILAPALMEARELALAGRAHELRAADVALAERLGRPRSARLGESGQRLLADLRGARSARWLERFQTWAADGSTPALFPTVFAARAALFQLPPRPMLAAYARLEWQAASVGPVVEAPTDALASLPAGWWHPVPVVVAA